jgi:uncharacterized protein
MSKNFILTTSRNEKLRITAFGLENLIFSPCLILVHGFKGFKDWGFGPYIGNYFANKGYFVITFNFSHNGVGESLTEFIELEKFANNTFSLEISELSELISAYLKGFFGNAANSKIGILGHSRGGAIALLTAKQRFEVNAVAIWSSVAKLDRYSERQKIKWRENGVFEVYNTRTKQKMKLNLSLLKDIEDNKDGLLNIENAIKELNRPLFIAHGEQDLAVPIKEAEQLFEWSNKNLTEFYRIKETGHTFNIKHPFEGSNHKFEELLAETNKFYKNNLTLGESC